MVIEPTGVGLTLDEVEQDLSELDCLLSEIDGAHREWPRVVLRALGANGVGPLVNAAVAAAALAHRLATLRTEVDVEHALGIVGLADRYGRRALGMAHQRAVRRVAHP